MRIKMNDNRNYLYSKDSYIQRAEYPIIVDWIPTGSSVIDLGCGDGTLLSLLKVKGVDGVGIDVSKSAVTSAMKKNVNVYQGRIDTKIKFKNKQFKYAICNTSIQMMMYPEIMLSEMVRISEKQIISFPNFAFILNRLELLLRGRMPKFMLYGYSWYSTGHIHQLSIYDFRVYCKDARLKILDAKYYSPGGYSSLLTPLINLFPNSLALSAIFLIGN